MMTLTVELPSSLEMELNARSEREGFPAPEQVSFLLQLILSMTRQGRDTPFQSVVRAYFRQNSFDADRLADLFEDLISYCLHNTSEDLAPAHRSGLFDGPLDVDRALATLRAWRSDRVNQPMEPDISISFQQLPRLDSLSQSSGRLRRDQVTSVMGKYAHLGGGSEDFMKAKQLELDREEGR